MDDFLLFDNVGLDEDALASDATGLGLNMFDTSQQNTALSSLPVFQNLVQLTDPAAVLSNSMYSNQFNSVIKGMGKKRNRPTESNQPKVEKSEVDLSKQKRLKWIESEIDTLWCGIHDFGNEWREIQKTLPGRTYHQVKDKGRRLLHKHGWSTGRTKNTSEGAKGDAIAIAKSQLNSTHKHTSRQSSPSNKRRKKTNTSKPKPPPAQQKYNTNGASAVVSDLNGNVFGGEMPELGLVGMNERVEGLRQAIAEGARLFPMQTTTVQVCGPSGIGKSSIVSDYVSKFKDFYTGGVYCLDGSLPTKLQQNLRAVHNLLTHNTSQQNNNTIQYNSAELMKRFYSLLAKRNKFLVIFENLEHEGLCALARPPPNLKGKGTVIVVKRTPDASLLTMSKCHMVPALSNAECVLLLQQVVNLPENKLTKIQHNALEEFIRSDTAVAIPAVITTAAHYLSVHGMKSARRLVDNIQLKVKELNIAQQNNSKYYANTIHYNNNHESEAVYNTMEAVWSVVKLKLKHTEVQVLQALAFFASDGIPFTLARQLLPSSAPSPLPLLNNLSNLHLLRTNQTKRTLTIPSFLQSILIQQNTKPLYAAFNALKALDTTQHRISKPELGFHLSTLVMRLQHLIQHYQYSDVIIVPKGFLPLFKKLTKDSKALQRNYVDVDSLIQQIAQIVRSKKK